MEVKTTFTWREIIRIQKNEIGTFIENREQADFWFELTTKDFPIERMKKDGSGPVEKRLTFAAARKRYFEKFFDIVKEEREMEKEALNIVQNFEKKAQEHGKAA